VGMLTTAQIRCLLVQMRHTDDGLAAAKVSFACMSFQALVDAYDSFIHFYLGLTTPYLFNTLAVISVLKFVLFSLIEVRYLLMIWRHNRREAFSQGWESIRRELVRFYSQLYGMLAAGLVAIYLLLDHLPLLVLCSQAYWVPQILLNIRTGAKSTALHPVFLVGTSAARSLTLLYVLGYPDGISGQDLGLRVPEALGAKLCVAVVLLQTAQVVTLFTQRSYGSRWFVPRICLPKSYNYHRKVDLDPDAECVICMAPLDLEDASRVVTPCNHSFHKVCLNEWIDVKMECPTCRFSIPPMD